MKKTLRPIRTATVIGIGLIAFGISGCGTAAPFTDAAATEEGYPVEIVDCGTTLSLDRAPQKVFTVGTAAVELIDAAGASDRIIARSGEFDAPLSPDVSNPPSNDLIVDAFDPTTEQIVGSGADTVIGYGLFSADPDQVVAAGIQLITVSGECGHDATTGAAPVVDFVTISDDVRRFGQIFGTSEIADVEADAISARIAVAERPASGEDAAWVYYFSGESGISAYGAVGIPDAALTAAGLENAFQDQEASYLDTSMEALLERQPQWIIISYGFTGDTAEQAKERFVAEPGAASLQAVTDDRIVLIPSAVTGAGPSAVNGVELLVAGTND